MEGTINGLSGRYKGQSAPLRPGTLTIGRDAKNSLSFPDDPHLSRNHAILRFRDGCWYCSDLGSTNGTYLDGKRVPNYPALIPQDSQLAVGGQVFRIQYTDGHQTGAVEAIRRFIGQLAGQVSNLKGKPVSQPPSRAAEPRSPVVASEAVPVPNRFRIGSSEWYGVSESLVVHGLRIQSPFAFVGEHLVHPKRTGSSVRVITQAGEEPGLINPRLPVSHDLAEALPYWPSYGGATPAQRFTYLKWLAEGRKPQIDQGYMFILLYGIERYLLSGGVKPDSSLVLLEVERLALENPSYHSFSSYAFNLLCAFWPTHPQRISRSSFAGSRRPTENDFVWMLGCLATARRPFTLELSLGWLNSFGKSVIKKHVVSRCWTEVESLFKDKFQQAFGDAIDLTATASKLHHPFQAANVSLRGDGTPPPVAFRAKGDLKIIEALLQIAVSCESALEPFARAIGTSGSKTLSLKALALVPKGQRHFQGQLTKLNMLFEAGIEESDGRIQLERIEAAISQNLKPIAKSRLEELSIVAENLGYLMEPDPRFGTPMTSEVEEILVVRSTEGQGQLTANYVALLSIASLSAWIARRGSTSMDQALDIFLSTSDGLAMFEDHRSRIALAFRWLYCSPKKPTANSVAIIPMELRSVVMNLLKQIVRTDGKLATQEITELIRIGDLFGIQKEAVISDLHNDDPIVVRSDATPSGYAIPKAPSSTFNIDHSVVQEKLRESNEISDILCEIFGTDDNPVPIFIEDSITATHSPYDVLIQLISTETLSNQDFVQLCRQANLLPGQARTYLNDLGFERVGAPVFEGDDPLSIDLQTLELLKHDLAYSSR